MVVPARSETLSKLLRRISGREWHHVPVLVARIQPLRCGVRAISVAVPSCEEEEAIWMADEDLRTGEPVDAGADGADEVEDVEDMLIEEVSIDGMCGVY